MECAYDVNIGWTRNINLWGMCLYGECDINIRFKCAVMI